MMIAVFSVFYLIPLLCAMLSGLGLLAVGIYLMFISEKKLAGGLILAVGGLLTVLPVLFFMFEVTVIHSRL
jgi:hypothetical protein